MSGAVINKEEVMKKQENLYATPLEYCMTTCPKRDWCGWKHHEWASYCASVRDTEDKKKQHK